MSLSTPSLMRLPPELIYMTLQNLIDDNMTLRNVCLVGNHTLLEIARPLTWHELNISCDVDEISAIHPFAQPNWHPFTQSLLKFSADPVKTAAVRSVTITLYGGHMGIRKLLCDALEKFINATHVHLICYEVLPGRDTRWLVRWVMELMPALVSMHIEGCNMDGGIPEEPIEPRSKSLKAIYTQYCDAAVHFSWRATHNIKVLEIQTGEGRYNGIEDGIFQPEWAEEGRLDAGAHYALKGPMADSLVRLCVRGNHGRKEDDLNLCDFAKFCRDLEEPFFPLLEELILDMAFDIEEYSLLLAKFAKPTIRVLSLSLDLNIEEVDVVSMFDNLASSGDCPLDGYLSLKEFWVPHEGTSESLTEILPNYLSAAPALEHIYFNYAENTARSELVRIAETYAKSIRTLRCVSWCTKAAIKITRDANNEPHGSIEAYVGPSWLEFRGVGPWREHYDRR